MPMDMFKPQKHNSDGPEAKIQLAIIKELKNADWFVKVTHGNMWQSGLPDLFCAHKKYGQKWVEVKNPLAWSFTPAQMTDFPLMSAHGVGIWILFSAHPDELQKLLRPANWFEVYLCHVNGVKYTNYKG